MITSGPAAHVGPYEVSSSVDSICPTSGTGTSPSASAGRSTASSLASIAPTGLTPCRTRLRRASGSTLSGTFSKEWTPRPASSRTQWRRTWPILASSTARGDWWHSTTGRLLGCLFAVLRFALEGVLSGVVLWVVAQRLPGAVDGVEFPVVVGDAGRACGASTAGRFLVVRSKS